MKRSEAVYAFVHRNSTSVVFRFRADSVHSIVKIFPVTSESIAAKERLLRSMLYLNRLHASPLRFLCRNFVEIQGAAFVQDEFPTSLLRMSSPAEPRSAVQQPTKEALFSCRNYIVISMEMAGTPLSRSPIKNAAQAKSILQQLCFTLATGERFASYCIDKADVDKVR